MNSSGLLLRLKESVVNWHIICISFFHFFQWDRFQRMVFLIVKTFYQWLWRKVYTYILNFETNLPDNSLWRISLLSMHCQCPFLTPNVAAFWREQEHEQWSLLYAVGDKSALNLLHLFWRLQESYDPGKLKLSCSSVTRFILTNFDSEKTERIWCCKYNTNKAHIPNNI